MHTHQSKTIHGFSDLKQWKTDLTHAKTTPSETPKTTQDWDFKQSIGHIQPIKTQNRIHLPTSPRQTRPTQTNPSAVISPTFAQDNAFLAASYVRHNVSKNIIKKIKKKWKTEDEMDLHGLNKEEACIALSYFMNNAQQRGFHYLKIIHGKGLGSKNHTPVLKYLVKNWLAQKENVITFFHAPENQGGEGALFVFINR